MDTIPERLGRYEILSLIGRGAMGVVYRARDPLIGREVALKRVSLSELLPEDQRKEFKERFFREARAAGNLRHPNVVTVYDVGESEGVPYMAMEFLSGGSLSALMKSGPLALDRAVSIVRQVALGLHYAHVRGIVHRDVKPDNIIMDSDGRPVVTDFGAAHLQSSELTTTGEVLGTPHYMSPEQILGEELDGRSDLFSLGVVFYLMVTGKRPFKGDTISAICYHIVHSPPEPVPEGVRVPPAVVPVLQKLLAKSRQERFADGEALAKALEVLEGESGGAPVAGSMTQTVCVPTPTPKPGTLPAPAPRVAAPVGKPAPKSMIRWGFWLLLGFLFLVFLILAVLGGAWVAHRMEMRASQRVVSSNQPPASTTPPGVPVPPLPAGVAPRETVPVSPAPPPSTFPTGKPPAPSPKPALVPKGMSAPPAPVVVAPAGPNPAVLLACESLTRDADRAVELAKTKDFTAAFGLADRFPQRVQEITRSAGPQEQAALATARERCEQAARTLQSEILAWARPTVTQAQKTYNKATSGRDDEDEIIRAYVQISPVLRWKERLPQDLRAEMDAFVAQVKEDLDEDEWAQAQAGGGK
jgi:serine/threonine-protein kinase